jgi:hypothetical protein
MAVSRGSPRAPAVQSPLETEACLKEKCMYMVSPPWAHVVVNRRGAEVCPADILRVSYITHVPLSIPRSPLSLAGDKAGKRLSWTSSTRCWSFLCSASPTRRIVASTDVKSVGCAATSSIQLLDKITREIQLALPRTYVCLARVQVHICTYVRKVGMSDCQYYQPTRRPKVPEKFPIKAWSMTAKAIPMDCIKSQGVAAVAAGPGQTRRRSNEQRALGPDAWEVYCACGRGVHRRVTDRLQSGAGK